MAESKAKAGAGKNIAMLLVALVCLGAAGYVVYWQNSNAKEQRTYEDIDRSNQDPYAGLRREALIQMEKNGEIPAEDVKRLREAGRLPAAE